MTPIRLLIIGFLITGSGISAQDNNPDPRLLNHFSEEQINELAANHPSRLAYWTFYLDHSYKIMDIASEKASSLGNLQVIDVSSKDFHAFTMNLDEYQTTGAVFRFREEDKMLLIKPFDQLIQEFNTHSLNSDDQ